MSEAEILCDSCNHVAIITLNRPAALNALSLGMVVELRALLERCAADEDVRAILLKGAGEKAFCAGGDIRALFNSFKTSGTLHHEFFALEYPVDYLLHGYPKPYIALLDGITMGGGMGLAQGSKLRIVGERTRLAMPEVSIGLFPDVGASYFLSRLSGSLGPYLALTGIQLRAADALYSGLADVYLPPAAIASLTADLTALVWSDDPNDDVRRLIRSRSVSDLPPAPLAALRDGIDRHFSKPTLAGILASLEGETRGDLADWARQTAALMRTRSPTMMAVALRELELGKTLSLADCFRMELGMVAHCFDQGDFIEGVRALIVEKDNKPRWAPDQVSDVSDASVEAFFRDRWTAISHPLAHLERTLLHA